MFQFWLGLTIFCSMPVIVAPDAFDFWLDCAEVDAATAAEIQSFPVDLGHAKKALAFSPDGQLLASTGGDGTQVVLWEMRTHHQSTRLTGHTDFVHSVAFSADGRLLASGGSRKSCRSCRALRSPC